MCYNQSSDPLLSNAEDLVESTTMQGQRETVYPQEPCGTAAGEAGKRSRSYAIDEAHRQHLIAQEEGRKFNPVKGLLEGKNNGLQHLRLSLSEKEATPHFARNLYQRKPMF